jgi:Fe-S-cluster containining protein
MDWIKRGLRFECQPDCGKCCTNARDGSLFLEPQDIERLAAHLDMSGRELVRRHAIVHDDGEIELGKRADGGCLFLEGARCGAYEARPLQCRVYPFFPLDGYTPIESPYTWEFEKSFCPGIGKGRLYRVSEIRAISRGKAEVAGFEV